MSSNPQRNVSSSTVLFERLRGAADTTERIALYKLYKECLAWEAARRARWFSSVPFYGPAIHKVSSHDCNTAWCGRPVPPNGPIVWYETERLPRANTTHGLSPRVCARCKRDAKHAGEMTVLYAQIEAYQQRQQRPGGVQGSW